MNKMNELFELVRSISGPEKHSDIYQLVILPIEIEKLDRLRNGILKWESISEQDFAAFSDSLSVSPLADYDYDPVRDEYVMLLETKRALWATFAVSISSSIEHLLGSMCRSLKLELPTKPNWGHKRSAIEKHFGNDYISKAPGLKEVTRMRLLANCYKHSSGRVDKELSDAFSEFTKPDPKFPDLAEQIRYEDENWPTLHEGAKMFMTAMVDHIDKP